MIQAMARDFARERLWPRAAQRDREGRIEDGLLADMGALGLMGMTVPEEWGGAGTDFMSYILALEEIAAGDGAVSTVMSVNNSPVCAALLKYGTDEQRARFLRPLARGEMIGAFCLTEPHAGSDAANLKTTARRDGDDYVLNGVKQFITSGKIAGAALVFAMTDPSAGKRGMSCFILPTDAPGYEIASVEHKLGQRASDTCQIVLRDVRVSAANLLGAPGEGYKIALANLESGRIGIAAQSVGMARAAFDEARAYAQSRTAFGKPIQDHQAIGFRLAEMATDLEAARQLTWMAARLRDAGAPCLREASMAKLYASEMAERVISAALQIHGGYGFMEDYPVARLYRDARVCQIYEGTSDIQKMVIARSLTNEG